MIKKASFFSIVRAMLKTPRIVLARPAVNGFLCRYLGKFKIMDVDNNLIIHSHLPPINSKAYSRFVDEHLLGGPIAPSHAQIAVTNACPYQCSYCYNRDRTGRVMDHQTILAAVRQLKDLGVFWLGLTGGEPLLNQRLGEIIECAAGDCAVKLFTTGCTLTKQRALELKQAGLFSVSVSLDHWQEERHDQGRNRSGAFRTALEAIEIFKGVAGLHVGVSAVLSAEMLEEDQVETFLRFLAGLDIHEAWLSEAKPSTAAYQRPELVVTQEQRERLIAIQDRHNKKGGMTVNYLGHFEDSRHFGCSAGHKMVYIDAFGDMSPCVFIPMSFGNVGERSVKEIYQTMQQRFPTESSCFINRNYRLLQGRGSHAGPIDPAAALALMERIQFSPLSKFFSLHYGKR